MCRNAKRVLIPMQVNETTLLGGLFIMMSATYAWAFKRQIARIDALEKAHADAQETRAANAVRLENLTEHFSRHMVTEEANQAKTNETLSALHEAVTVIRTKIEAS